MGLLTRLGSIFVRHPGADASGAGTPIERTPGFDEARETDVVDPLEALDEDEGGSSMVTTRPVNLTRPVTRRTKQEWFDELQRNHQELVELVRKFDAHLDREGERDARSERIAAALERTAPAVERLAEEVGARLDQAAERMHEAVEASAARAERSAEGLGRSLTTIADHLQQSAGGQADLVTRLAEFRQTMGEMARASAESARLLADMSERDAKRQGDMERRLASMRLWIILGVSAALAVACVAVALGVMAMVNRAA